MSINNKIALVTGAGRGIGKNIAIALGREGATVIGADINVQMAAEVDTYLQKEGLKGGGVVMDVTNTESIAEALKTIKANYAAPDILVNNAGITRDNLMLRMKPEEWDAVISTNLSSIYKVTQACLRDMMKTRWGRIIGIASVVGLSGNAGQANYSAAKAGLIGFSKSLAQEVGSRGITVNAVAPGFIDTKMTQALSEEQREALLTMVPLRKIGLPDDVANAVVFLASERACYITGETINVNGGMYMA